MSIFYVLVGTWCSATRCGARCKQQITSSGVYMVVHAKDNDMLAVLFEGIRPYALEAVCPRTVSLHARILTTSSRCYSLA